MQIKLIIFICSEITILEGERMALKVIRKIVKIYFTLMYILPIALAVIRTIQSFKQEKKQPEEKQ